MSKKLAYLATILSLASYATADLSEKIDPAAHTSEKSTSLASEGEKPTKKASQIASTQPFEPFSGKVKGKRVRVRVQPKLESFVLREARLGELFSVVGESNNFYAIRAPKDTKGYVFRTHILDGVVEGDRVNVRLAPDLESPVIGQLKRGEKITSTLSPGNNKWFEIELPQHMNFYIAQEYVERVGDPSIAEQQESKRQEALHRLNAALCFASSEIQKPFEEVDVTAITGKLSDFAAEYALFSDLAEKAQEATRLIEDSYVHKKIAFLESKNEKAIVSADDLPELKRLFALSHEVKGSLAVAPQKFDPKGASQGASLAAGAFAPSEITDKMAAWQTLEESLYHLWAAEHHGRSIDEFYAEERENATILTGIVESYDRPVKNRPGDYLLRSESMPVAFLYSTRVNLETLVGKKVTLFSITRNNNHFAFPAYFVLSAE